MRRTAVIVMLAIAPIVAAQTTAQRPQFEVASIKFSPTSRFVPAVVIRNNSESLHRYL